MKGNIGRESSYILTIKVLLELGENNYSDSTLRNELIDLTGD